MPEKEKIKHAWRRAKREGYKGSLRAFIKILSKPDFSGMPAPWSKQCLDQ